MKYQVWALILCVMQVYGNDSILVRMELEGNARRMLCSPRYTLHSNSEWFDQGFAIIEIQVSSIVVPNIISYYVIHAPRVKHAKDFDTRLSCYHHYMQRVPPLGIAYPNKYAAGAALQKEFEKEKNCCGF